MADKIATREAYGAALVECGAKYEMGLMQDDERHRQTVDI